MSRDALLRFLEETEAVDGQGSLRLHASLATLCTMRVGGEAAAVYQPSSKEMLCDRLFAARRGKIPFHILGGGSNTVAGDGRFCGVVFLTRGLHTASINGTNITADTGCPLNKLALAAARAGLAGLEGLYGIPGTVGGGVKMNAGAHGTDIASTLSCATLFSLDSGERRVFQKEELAFSYRESLLQHTSEWVVLDATFSCTPSESSRLKERIAALVHKRRLTQPLDLPSAGSVFRRPPEGEVWRMVDRCGLRGYTIGGAQVSPLHAGFIVNRGGATAKDVCHLVQLLQERVFEECGVRLAPEIEFFHLNEEEKCHLQKP